MIYGNESISQYTKSNMAIWMSMALQGGLLNMGGFLACHRFVSHITGFAAFFGVELTQTDHNRAVGMLIVPMFFLFGCMLSGLLVDIRLRLHKKPKYYISFGLIFILLLLVFLGGEFGYFGEFGEPLEQIHNYILLTTLCLVCGIQNGTITTVSKSVVRTTHLTGITTDLGIGIMRYFYRDKLGHETKSEDKINAIRVGIIFFFILGSVIGGFVFKTYGFGGFIIPVITSGILFLLMLYFQSLGRDRTT